MIDFEERWTVIDDCSDLSIDVETEFVAWSPSTGRTVDIFEESANARSDLVSEENLRDSGRFLVRALNHVAVGEIRIVTVQREWSSEVSRRNTASASERNTEPILLQSEQGIRSAPSPGCPI